MNKLILTTLLLVSQVAFGKTSHPVTVSELKETSVRILNLAMNSGGTGSIFRSYSNATHILTNKHVCRLIEPGGVVDYKGKQYLITHYKKFPDHDLCIVRVATSFGVNLEVAELIADESDKSVVSGHPNLLPHIVTTGHLSERMTITLMNGVKLCTKEDLERDPAMCVFMGGIPVLKQMESRVVSNLIKPGSSGSAVFNSDGDLIGVVYAGSSREFSYGFIVPQEYLISFIRRAHLIKWVAVGTPVDDEGITDRVFNFDRCKEVQFLISPIYKNVKDICKNISDNMIWSK